VRLHFEPAFLVRMYYTSGCCETLQDDWKLFMVPHSKASCLQVVEVCFIFALERSITLSKTVAIDRAEQIAALADRRHRQQDKLAASLFDQASPPSSFDSSGKLIEDDKEGTTEFSPLLILLKANLIFRT